MSEQEIQRYREMLQKDPKSRAFAPLAELYRKMARLEDAIATAQEGLKHHPSYAGGLVVLGRALFEKGDLEHSADIMQKAVKEAPENYLAQKFLGKVLMARGDNDRALKAMEIANFLSPDDQEVAAALGELRTKVTPPETMRFDPKGEAVRSEFTHKTGEVGSERGLSGTIGAPEAPQEAGGEVAEIDLDELPEAEDFGELEVSLAEEEGGGEEAGSDQEVYIPEEELAELGDLEDLVPIEGPVEGGVQENEEAGYPGKSGGTEPEPTDQGFPPVMVSEPVSFGPDSALLEFPEPPVTEGLKLGEADQQASAWQKPQAAAQPLAPSAPAGMPPAGKEAGISTETLADLYAQQGFTDKAVQIYRQLLERRPGDAGLLAKLGALEQQAPAGGPAPAEAGQLQEVSPAQAPPKKAPSHDPIATLEGWLSNLERMKKR